MRLIDADALKDILIDNALRGNGKLELISIIDNAPTVEPRIEYGTDGQAYRLFISGGQVVPDMLQGWKYEEKPTGEWIVVSNGITNHYACSECGHAGDFQDKFCPNCGAEMRKEAEE